MTTICINRELIERFYRCFDVSAHINELSRRAAPPHFWRREWQRGLRRRRGGGDGKRESAGLTQWTLRFFEGNLHVDAGTNAHTGSTGNIYNLREWILYLSTVRSLFTAEPFITYVCIYKHCNSVWHVGGDAEYRTTWN
jgi:hypothetical protein